MVSVVEGLLRWLRRLADGKRPLTLADLDKVTRATGDITSLAGRVLPGETGGVHRLTYSDAVGYFVSARPDDSRVCKGALLRQPHLQGHLVVQVFLDQQDELVCGADGRPYGRHLIAFDLDDELREAFGRHNLILVK
jgi:hypothetical protein